MDAHKTDTDDLVERLEDSKGWPNLGKAAAARIRALEAEKKELALDVLAAQGQAADLEAENARLRKALGKLDNLTAKDAAIVSAALQENATDNAPTIAGSDSSRSARQPAISEPR